MNIQIVFWPKLVKNTQKRKMGNLPPAHTNEDVTDQSVSTTWNGAESYGTITDPLVELFFKSVRNIPCTDYRCITVKQGKHEAKNIDVSGAKSLESYFEAAWKANPELTLKFVFYLRDCRGGKGERKLFRALIRYMLTHGLTQHVIDNLKHIPFFGSWKDVSMCFFGTPFEDFAIGLIAEQLLVDKNAEHPSLCAKYAPSEGGAIDKVHKAASKIAAELNVSLTQYRKQYLAPLRAKLNIVEREMCARHWNEISYEKVPSIAGTRYKKAFNSHDEARYTEYLKQVQKGEKKMNTSVLMPYQMVSPYIHGNGACDETIEAQWVSFLAHRRTKWPKGLDVLPLIDVSSSMFNGADPQPGEVAVSLGMLFSLLNSSSYYQGKFITFHEHPELLAVNGDNLYDQVKSVQNSAWGGNTNMQAAFDLILNIATTFQVPTAQMPKILLILSDMQFDSANNNAATNWETIEQKYTAAGYERPIIIFWNLNGTSLDFPAPNVTIPRCMLLSGYNDAIMYALLDGTLPNPESVVLKALNNERYNVIKYST